ncbi:hypothetical protein BHM03_00012622 [Ensete ventricosum]|nr:hypothetical protein BHM03_00012622 [Ensete ventricosum]
MGDTNNRGDKKEKPDTDLRVLGWDGDCRRRRKGKPQRRSGAHEVANGASRYNDGHVLIVEGKIRELS